MTRFFSIASATTSMRRPLSVSVALWLFTAVTFGAEPDIPGVGRTAPARPAAEWDANGKPVRIDFDFGDVKAWARRDGSWNAEGTIQHRGMLCATYTLSLRVGRGEPACNKVKWFNEPRAVANTVLCNNAPGFISGGNTEFRDKARFNEITCAERTISCSGNCQ